MNAKYKPAKPALSGDHFSVERPIESSAYDLLDRKNFSQSIADAITGWRQKDSLVVAIYGKWGSGKSSLKNMVVEALEAHKAPPVVLEFNPWSWPASDDLSESFFRELALSIGRIDKSKESRRLASKLRRYGAYLSAGAYILTGVSKALPYLLAAAILVGIGGAILASEVARFWTVVVLLILALVASLLAWMKGLLAKIARIATERATATEKTLIELKEEIKVEISKLTRGVVVVMDDIDRLESERVREVMQLVRQNADFPNIVYLLLFQRDIVENLLTEKGRKGRDYLEKIVQVPFNLPEIEKTRLDNILFNGLDRILSSDSAVLEHFDRIRWGNLYEGVLKNKIQTLRDVYRLLSTLEFHVSILRGDRALEVNPIDLVGIETMRVFEPEFHNAIYRARNLLTGHSDQNFSVLEDQIKEDIHSITEFASEEFREAAAQFLKQLFPNIEWAFEGSHYTSDFAEEWFHHLRICVPQVFENYFRFSVGKDEIGRSELKELVDLSASYKRLSDRLSVLRGENRLPSALRQLDTYKQKIPIENAPTFLRAMLELGDLVGQDRNGFFEYGSHTRIRRIVYWYVMQEDSSEERSGILESAVENSTAISMLCKLLITETQFREKGKEIGHALVTDESLERLKEMFLLRLETRAAEYPSDLLENEHLANMLFCWRRWGKPEAATAWVSACFDDDNYFPSLLGAFVSETASQGFTDLVGERKKNFQIDSFETFIDRTRLHKRLSEFDDEAYSKATQEILDTVRQTLVEDE
ncbi:MAG: P-loop NTPase fold protein [Candidatus Poribacteria bacterium]|nr:P-loop NTPase fold protein [Candidatus Poribacteria bacterium]